jgi:hypothetical protein
MHGFVGVSSIVVASNLVAIVTSSNFAIVALDFVEV